MRKFLLLLLFLGVAGRVVADEVTALVIHDYDGGRTVWIIGDRPKVTYSSDSLLITSAGVEASYPLDDMWKFTFEQVEMESTAIAAPSAETLAFSYNGDMVIVSNLVSGSLVRVFTPGGILIKSERPSTDSWIFQFSDIPSGIYIVDVNGKSFKISKR